MASWARGWAVWLAAAGMLAGAAEGAAQPAAPAPTEAFRAGAAPGAPADAGPRTTPFADVPRDHWAWDAVEQLRRRGILRGYPPAPRAERHEARPLRPEARRLPRTRPQRERRPTRR